MTTKTTTRTLLDRGRRPLAGAVVSLTLLLASCSTGGDPAEAAMVPTTSTPSAAPSVEAGITVLGAALERYDGGYTFVSEAFVGAERALRIEGRQVGEGSLQLITSGDGIVEFLVIGGEQWARTPGEPWDVVSEGAALAAPLAVLADPLAVTVPVATATRTELEATYPADRFGLTGDDLVVHIVIQDLLLRSVGYATGDGDVRATVETRFEPLADTTPITAPLKP